MLSCSRPIIYKRKYVTTYFYQNYQSARRINYCGKIRLTNSVEVANYIEDLLPHENPGYFTKRYRSSRNSENIKIRPYAVAWSSTLIEIRRLVKKILLVTDTIRWNHKPILPYKTKQKENAEYIFHNFKVFNGHLYGFGTGICTIIYV